MFVSVFSWFFLDTYSASVYGLPLKEFAFLRDVILAWFALGNLNIISISSSYDVADGVFLPCHAAFFALLHLELSAPVDTRLDRHAVF